MNEYWIIPTNGKWVHVKADDYVIKDDSILFVRSEEVVAQFFKANIVGITFCSANDKKEDGIKFEMPAL